MLIDSKRPFFLVLALLIFSLVGIISYKQYQKISEKNRVVIYTSAGPIKINVEYAQTPEKQKQGLAERASLDKNSGMLFVFPNEKIREFWMKDMLIPLEIMFIDTNGRINEITTLEPCLSNINSCPVYVSKKPARFAIEVNSGFSERAGITNGDILEISGF